MDEEKILPLLREMIAAGNGWGQVQGAGQESDFLGKIKSRQRQFLQKIGRLKLPT